MLRRIRKNDTATVISGKDKGKKGTVLSVDLKKGRVLVKDIAVVSKHTKPRRQGETGGIKKEETFVPLAKVMPVCPSCKQGCRVRSGEQKARTCHRCDKTF